jgi:hypothetical protein
LGAAVDLSNQTPLQLALENGSKDFVLATARISTTKNLPTSLNGRPETPAISFNDNTVAIVYL